jgi:hypothetical protein
MKKKIFGVFTLCALLLSVAGVNFADKRALKANENSELLALLPESEMVLTLDVRRFFDEALPQILSANQSMLNSLFAKIDEVKALTGIDVRQFQQVAIGVSSKKIAEKSYDFEPLILARGQFDANAIVAIAKLVSKGNYREEKIGERTVYIFSAKEMVEENKDKIDKNSMFASIIDKVLKGLTRELAVTAYNNNTLALGTTERMRAMLENKKRVSGQILSLLAKNPNAIINFGAEMPQGLTKLVNLEIDEFSKNLDAIRQLSGAMDILNKTVIVSLSAKTLTAEQAKVLTKTLTDLQSVGSALLSGSKGADKKVYARMVENARITQLGNEVSLNLKVPQSDIDVLIGEKK